MLSQKAVGCSSSQICRSMFSGTWSSRETGSAPWTSAHCFLPYLLSKVLTSVNALPELVSCRQVPPRLLLANRGWGWTVALGQSCAAMGMVSRGGNWWFFICDGDVCMHAKSLQSCPTLCYFVDRSWPGSSVRGILQARILEGIAISFYRGSSQPRDQTCISYVSCIAGEFFTTSATWEAPWWGSCCSILSHWEGDNSNITVSRMCSVLGSNLNGKRIWRRIDTCVCVTESFCCVPEANTTLLISCRSAQCCLTLCCLTDCRWPGCPVHGIFQARLLKWAAISCSRAFFPPRIEPMSLCLLHWQADPFPLVPPVVIQLLSGVWLFLTPWTAACLVSLFFTWEAQSSTMLQYKIKS